MMICDIFVCHASTLVFQVCVIKPYDSLMSYQTPVLIGVNTHTQWRLIWMLTDDMHLPELKATSALKG